MKELNFIVEELPPGLNKLLKLEFYEYGRERDRWLLLVRQAIGRKMTSFPGRIAIKYDAYRVQLMDDDNHHGSFKLVGDALKNLGIIRDDGPKFIDKSKSSYQQHKIPYRACQRIEITIQDLSEQDQGKPKGKVYCGDCGGEIDQSVRYRRGRHGRAMHEACYTRVKAALRRQGMNIDMTLIEPAQQRIEGVC